MYFCVRDCHLSYKMCCQTIEFSKPDPVMTDIQEYIYILWSQKNEDVMWFWVSTVVIIWAGYFCGCSQGSKPALTLFSHGSYYTLIQLLLVTNKYIFPIFISCRASLRLCFNKIQYYIQYQFSFGLIMKPFGVVSSHQQAPARVYEVSIVHPEEVQAQAIVKMPKPQAYQHQARIHVIDRSRNVPTTISVPEPVHVIQRTRPALIKPVRPIRPAQPNKEQIEAKKDQQPQPLPQSLKPTQKIVPIYEPQQINLVEQNQKIDLIQNQTYHRVYSPRNNQNNQFFGTKVNLSQDASQMSQKSSALRKRIYDPRKNIQNIQQVPFMHKKINLSQDGSELSMKQSNMHSRVYKRQKNAPLVPIILPEYQKVNLSEDGSELSMKESAIYHRLYDPKKQSQDIVVPIIANQKVNLSEDGSVLSVYEHERYYRDFDPQKQNQLLIPKIAVAPLSYLLESEDYQKKSEPDLTSKLSHHRQIRDQSIANEAYVIHQKIVLSQDGSVLSMKQSSIFHRNYDPNKNVNPAIIIPFALQKVDLSEDGSVISANQNVKSRRVYQLKHEPKVQPIMKPVALSYLLASQLYEKQSEPDLSSKVRHRRQKNQEADPLPEPISKIPPIVPPPSYEEIEAVSFPLIQPIILQPEPQNSPNPPRLQQVEVVSFPSISPIVF